MFGMSELFVADKGGAIFYLDLQDETVSTIQVGTLRKRIKEEKPNYGERLKFLGNLGSAGDDELVSDHINIWKKDKIIIARPWNSWYGTYLEEQISRVYPRLSKLQVAAFCIVFIFVFVGLIIGFTRASFSLPNKKVPYTLQTLGVFLATFFLGIWSAISVSLYLILGLVGGHVFAGNSGGIEPLLYSYSSGFLWGFLATAIVVGLLVSWRGWDRNAYTWFLATCIGWITTFLPGLVVFAAKANWDWNLAVNQAVVPFLPAEAIKFAIVLCVIPMTWFATSHTLNALNPRTAIASSLKNDMKAFFNPRLISF